jgi:drug/metabolite transporter (DMT)-like permease
MNRDPSHVGSITTLLCASALSSIGWILEGEAIARLEPLAVSCVALLLGGIILLCIARIRGPMPPGAGAAVTSPDFLIFSLIRSALLSTIFCYCLTLTSSTKVMFLTKIEPYIVLLIHIIWHNHRTTWQHLTLLAVHIAGAVLLSTSGNFTLSLDTLGDLLVLMAVTASAALYAPTQRHSKRLGPSYAAGFSQLFGGIILLPFVLIYNTHSFTVSEQHTLGWLYVLLTVLVFHVISTGLWFSSIRHVPAWLASALRSFGPVLAAPIAWLFFEKPLTTIQTLGALIVIITSAWMVILEGRTTSAQRDIRTA